MSTVIKVENVSKLYRLGEVGTGTLSHDLNRWYHRLRGKEDPYLKIGESNDRAKKASSEYVYALKEINFEIKEGEVLGIIGKNGAGKSTLLKLLSRVTGPSSGCIKIKGRTASLLEVGTGFHPELTGRENIFLNGAILGMTKLEIRRKFDEIVDFSGVERYIDTPVKRYSSGMYVRLAFAVAAHLDPEILIVDEVLAVGDAEFQKRCLGKMNDISKNEGRTILFVSHNMLAIKSLCSRGVLISKGQISQSGPIDKLIEVYSMESELRSSVSLSIELEYFTLKSIWIKDNGINGCFNITNILNIFIEIEFKTHVSSLNINIFFNTPEGGLIFVTCSTPQNLVKGTYIFSCEIPANILNDNIYCLDVMVVSNDKVLHTEKEVINIEGIEPKREGSWLGKFPGLIRPLNFDWKITEK